MRIERRHVDHGVRFDLVGAFHGTARRQIERMLSGAVSDGSIVTLDLSEVERCDEAGANLLVSLTQRAKLAGGALALRSVPDDVLKTFDLAGVLSKLQVVDATNDTAKSFATAPAYLFRVTEASPFAYASSRHDFSLVADDRLWAHRSHNWLVEAGSGALLAHRIGNTYYSADTGERAYIEETSPKHP